MDFNFGIGFLKVISMLSAGLFGALGLITQYRDKDGAITKWGKTAIAGIFISTAISLGMHVLETSRAKHAAEQARAESDATKAYLQNILVKAQSTAEQQEKSLAETVQLKTSLEENLKRTSSIADDMKITLGQQTAIARGQEIAIATQFQQIKMQEQQLEELRRLYLAQYRLAGLEVSWGVSGETIKEVSRIFGSKMKSKTDYDQLFGAGGAISIGMKRGPNSQPTLTITRSNRYGFLERKYAPGSVEWEALDEVLELLRSPRFFITLVPDIPVMGMSSELGPAEVIIAHGRIAFTIQSPDLKLSQLQDAQWMFRSYYNSNVPAPKKMRLRSLDSAVLFDTELGMNWEERDTDECSFIDQGGCDYVSAFFSGPHNIPIDFSRILSPKRTQ